MTRGVVHALDWVAPRSYPRAVFATEAEAFVYLGERLGMSSDDLEAHDERLATCA